MDPQWADDPGWPFLRASPDAQMQAQSARKFDSKTHFWIPDPTEGFVIGKVETEEENKLTVMLPNGSKKTMNRDEAQEINPAKYERTEDMANLTFLNEASVLHNLRQRYASMMIYTYSGLFLVFINPYKMLPIYTDTVANMFVNRRRTEMPPHLFAVSDLAYRNMLNDHENQSMLITGESGAGKTENTKKVISYFARIGQSSGADEPKKKTSASLEEQVVQANPAIEAFGNGATNRNYNSSRYGKFIRIHFNSHGKLVGGDIEHYAYMLNSNIRDYHFVSQAEITVPGMNDAEEFAMTDNAFDVMGFSLDEKDGLYKTCAAIMHMGEMKFKQKPREEQAEAEDMTSATNAAALLGINVEKFVGAFLKPQVKVGAEWVSKGQTVQQVEWGVGALSMAIYARMFHWIIKRCNQTLSSSQDQSANYIGVLDIAGFEIFDKNSFEQLWINFVNEKLQQFFNHHMFVLEQEEYEREGIVWQFIDFGLDLQSCIELIEKPLGIISMLDEECIVPKATDSTYVEKLISQHLGKHPNFVRPKGKTVGHFAVVHYAGTVNYNAELWLDKNKDPLNDTAVSVLKTAPKESAIYQFWADYKTAVDLEEEEKRGKGTVKKKGKSGSFMTVSTMYRDSLSSLMTMLHSTQPHFIRCIIPNEKKQSGLIEAALVLNQLTCNGVLEGIRICRKGFPNRMVFPDFRHRYAVLAADEAARAADLAEIAAAMLNRLCDEGKLQVEDFRVGRNKVFFRTGVIARLEELRDAALSVVVAKFQSACRAYLARCDVRRREQSAEASEIIQDNVRQWLDLRVWPWFRLYSRIKPMLTGLQSNAQVKEMETKLKEMEEKNRMDAELHSRLTTDMNRQKAELDELRGNYSNQTAVLERRKAEIKELNDELDREKNRFGELEAVSNHKIKSLEKESATLREKAAAEKRQLEADAQRAQNDLKTAQNELFALQNTNLQLVQQRKAQDAANAENVDQLEILQNKFERMDAERRRTLEELEQTEDRLNAEKRLKEESQKEKRKVESELKQMTEKFERLQAEFKNGDQESRRLEYDIGQWRTRAHEDANLISKLQSNIRQLVARIEELEAELESEQREKLRADKLKTDAQTELGLLHEQIAETNGQLEMQLHLNKNRQQELAVLQRELEKRTVNHDSKIADLCSMQWLTLNNLRNLSQQAQFLENEANRVLDFRKASVNGAAEKPLARSMSTREFYKHSSTEYRP